MSPPKEKTKLKSVTVRLPPDVALSVNNFREVFEARLSQNAALVLLIERGLSASPELEEQD